MIYYSCYFFFILVIIPLVDAGGADYLLNGVFKFPDVTNDGFSCSPSNYTSHDIYPTFTSQTSIFISTAYLLFTVAVYGTTSKLSYRRTVILDDFLILSLSIASILSWFLTTKIVIYITHYYHNGTNEPWLINDTQLIIIFFSLLIISVASIAFLIYYFYGVNNGELTESKRSFFNHFKTMIVWIYFIHSIVIIISDYYDYQTIFAPYLSILSLTSFVNLEFLNYLIDVVYLIVTTCLILTYHSSKVESWFSYLNFNFRLNRKSNFLHKRIFFFCVFLSVIQLFFEYNIYCTPPLISKIFNSLLTTVLTRSIVSFFSEGGILTSDNIEKSGNTKKRVWLRIEKKKDVECLIDRNLHIKVKNTEDTEKIKNDRDDYRKALKEQDEFKSNDSKDIGKELLLQKTVDKTRGVYVNTIIECAVDNKVYVDILGVGILYYILYSHRSSSEYHGVGELDGNGKELENKGRCDYENGYWYELPPISIKSNF